MREYFLDTSYVLALELSDDRNHDLARQHWTSLSKPPPMLVTTSFVFAEVVTFLNDRRLHAKAVEVGRRLLQSRSVELVQVDPELFWEGWALLERQQDKTYSLTDCISFSLMKRKGLRMALAFDRHFAQAGFVTLPRRP